MRRLVGLVAVPVILIAAGCGQTGTPRGGGGPSGGMGGGGPSGGTPRTAFEKRAEEAADAWRTSDAAQAWRTGFVPAQTLTVLLAEAGFTEGTKTAYDAGWFRSRARLSTGAPPTGPSSSPVVRRCAYR